MIKEFYFVLLSSLNRRVHPTHETGRLDTEADKTEIGVIRNNIPSVLLIL